MADTDDVHAAFMKNISSRKPTGANKSRADAGFSKRFVVAYLPSSLATEQECSVPGKVWQVTTGEAAQCNSVVNTEGVTVCLGELG